MAKESNGRADAGVRAESASNVKTQAEQALLAQQALEAELLKQKQAEEALLAKKEEEEAVEGDQEAAPAEQAEAAEAVESELTSVFADSADGASNVMVAQSGNAASDASGAADAGWGLGTWVAIGAGATAAVAFALAGDDDNENVAPTAGNFQLATPINEDNSFTGTLPAANEANVTYAVVSQPANGTITITDAATGAFTYTPNANFNGVDTFTFSVTDSGGLANTYSASIPVAAVNDAPVAAATQISTQEDQAVSGQLPQATDVEGDTVTYSLASAPPAAAGTVTIGANGAYTFTPAQNFNGSTSFTYTVSDGNGGSNTYTVSVNVGAVNDAPVAANGSATGNEDTVISGSLAGLASDVDGDTLTFALGAQASNGTVSINSSTGAYTYTPNANFNGNDSFTFTVSDGNGGTATATVNLTVAPVNDAPVATNLTVSATEDQVLNGNLPAATDVDGDSVTYALNTGAANGTVTVNANGSFIYVPNANFNGADAFTYTVSDGNGGSSTYTVNVNVANVNDAPVGANGSASTNEDVVLNGTLPVATDVDGDTLTYALATGPANGTVVVNANGTYTYTPAANFNGNDSFTFTVSDGNGGLVTYTQSITVAAVNDAPVAQDQTLPGIEDTVLNGSVTATDVDGDALTFSVAGGGVTANGGSVVMQPNGSFAYTPFGGFSGTDSFTYTVSDGNGGTDTGVITINVQEVADVFTLGLDTFIGNANDEVFTAVNNTLNAGDSVDGGGGFDIVTHSVDVGGGANYAGFIFNNVDVFQVTSDSPNFALVTYDLSSSGPIGVLRVQNTTDSVFFSNAAAGANNTTFLEVLDQTGTATNVSLDMRDNDVTGNSDVVDVTVRSATNTGDALNDLEIDFAVETVVIHTDGPLPVVIDTLNTELGGGVGSGAVNVVLDAQDSSLTIRDALDINVKNVNGSSSTQNLSYSVVNANGNTTLSGGAGNDTIVGALNQSNNITSNAGNDSVTGGNASDVISAGAGNDVVNGLNGNDTITTAEGNDTVNLGAGNNVVDTGTGNDSVNDGNGNSNITTGEGADVVNLGQGNDTVLLGAGADTVNAGDNLTEGDVITGGADADLLNIASTANAAASQLNDLDNVTQVERIVLADTGNPGDSYAYRPTNAPGNVSAFVLDTTATEVDASALDANETLNFDANGRIGNLTLIGGDGSDTLIGGNGNDVIVGDGDNGNADLINGAGAFNGGNDSLSGGGGNDEFRFDGNELTLGDTILGGSGSDTITLVHDGINPQAGTTEVFELRLDAGSSIELVKVEDNYNNAPGRIVDLTVVNTHAQALTNVDATELDSNEGFDFDASAVAATRRFSVESGDGNDTLVGGAGGDTINGNDGNDFLDGSAGGNDSLGGGAGNDTFSFGDQLTNDGLDTVSGGGAGETDVVISDSVLITDQAFQNFTSTEVLTLTDNAGSDTTLASRAQAAGFDTVNLNGSGNDILDASGYVAPAPSEPVRGLTVNDNGAAGSDTIITGAGDDTVNTAFGSDLIVLNGGNDLVVVQTSELDFSDRIAGGAGSDTVQLDGRGGSAVTAGVNLTNVTGVEEYVLLDNTSSATPAGPDSHALTFTGGNVLTVTDVLITSGTNNNDTFTVTLDAGQQDGDYRFTFNGTGGREVFVKDNDIGANIVNNNIVFNGGGGSDELQIRGDALGSTVTMNGGDGIDAIRQQEDTGTDLIDDDGYQNVSNVEQLIAGGVNDRVNATLGANAEASGLNAIIGGTGSDDVTFDAAFNTATSIDLSADNAGVDADFIDASATNAALTISADAADINAADTLLGGTSAGDSLNLTADNGTATLTNVSRIETFNVVEGSGGSDDDDITINFVNGNFTGVASGRITVDASALNDTGIFLPEGTLTLNAGAITAGAFDVTGGTGDDTISTGTGSDVINAGLGNDVVNAGNGNNVVNGGAGNDDITTGTGNDTIDAGDGNDLVASGDGNDSVDGGTGNDTIFGGNGLNTLNGGDGNDEITGGNDVDVINGGTGNDEIYAGLGNNAGAGDTLTGGSGNDTFYYVARAESSTSLSGRDVITDFESSSNPLNGSDVIDFRYVAEAVAQYGAGALINFSGNAANFGLAQGAITAGDNVLDVVFQQDDNVLWVDLNDDGVLNGNDLQIILQGVTTLAGADVLSGAAIGQTPVLPGVPVVGTILDETFVLAGAPPPGYVIDGKGGNDTVVINGQDISGSTLTNIEFAQVIGSAGMSVAQHNGFVDILGTGVETITLTTGGMLTGDAQIGTYNFANFDTDFTLGANGQNVNGGNGNDTIRTGPIDLVTGNINGGGGSDTLVVDSGDDLTGATFTGIEQTLVTLSSIRITAAQHGTNGTNGQLGNIVDAGDVAPNSPDTVTISDSTETAFPGVGITGVASMENYVLSGGDDRFTLGVGSQNVNTGAGNNVVITGAQDVITGTIGGVGNDTLITDTGDNLTGANITAVETIEIDGVVTMTAGQHAAATVQDTNGSTDNVTIANAGTVNASANIETYTLQDNNLVPGTSTLNVNAATTNVNVNGANTLAGTNVNVGGLTVNGTYTLLGSVGDTITATNGANIAGVNAGAATSAETLSLTDGITMTRIQHEAFGDIDAAGGADAVTVLGLGTVTAFEDVETYNISSAGTNTLIVNALNTAVDINGGANGSTVIVGGLTVTGNYNLTGGLDFISTTSGADISGVNGGAATTATNISLVDDVTMTLAQHNGFTTIDAAGVSDEITLTTSGALTGDADVETYNLADGAGNVFTLGAMAQNVNGGADNDVVQTGGLATITGMIDLGANAGAPNDQLVITGADVDMSGVNGGGETTAETLDMGIFNATMTELQHEGFLLLNAGGGANTITLDDANGDGVLTGDADVETYVLNDAFTFTVGAAWQSVTGDGANNQTVIVDGLTATGTLDGGAAGNDTLDLRNGADISGAMISNFENLLVTGSVSMTETQYESFASITGGAGTTIVITAFDGDGVLSIGNNVETYTFQDSGTVNVLAGSEAVDINGTAGQPLTVNVGGLTVTGDYALGDAADVIIATAGADISGVNSGAATTAELIDVTGDVTMTVPQHAAFVAANGIDAAGVADQITLSDSGTVDADADIETYVLGALGGSTLNVDAAGTAVNVTGTGGSDVVNVDGLTVTGTYSLGGAADEITATTGADISGVNGGAATTAEQLNLTGIITMTVAQHTGFGTGNIVAGGGADEVILADGGVVVVDADVEQYTSAFGGTFNLFGNSATATNVTSTAAGADIISAGGQVLTGTYDLGAGSDEIVGQGGFDITGATLTAIEGLRLDGAGTFTMTGDQYNAFTAGITDLGGDTQTIVLTTAAAGVVIADDDVENFTLQDAGADSITFSGADAIRGGQSVDLTAGGADQVTISNVTIDVGSTDALTVSGFGADDLLVLEQIAATTRGVDAGVVGVPDFLALANSGNVAVGPNAEVLAINAGGAINLMDAANAGEVETLIADSIGSVDQGEFMVIVYSDSSLTADAGIYHLTLGANSADLAVSQFDIELVGVLEDFGANNFSVANLGPNL